MASFRIIHTCFLFIGMNFVQSLREAEPVVWRARAAWYASGVTRILFELLLASVHVSGHHSICVQKGCGECERGIVRASKRVRACMSACVHACVHACARACA